MSNTLNLLFTVICGLILPLQPWLNTTYTTEEALTTENKIYSPDIKTVEIRLNTEIPSYPILQLGSNDVLQISFDDLSDYSDDYYYKILHCTHDWQISDIEQNEYISGFPELSIDEVESSFNTAISYTHYEFTFPSEMMKPTISGNYLLVIYPEFDSETPIITSRIIVYEQRVRYRARVKEPSEVKELKYMQEIDFDLVYNGYQIDRPYEHLHNTILQNFNWETGIYDLPPVFVKNSEVSYDYGDINNFNGNNEFRFFSSSSLNNISSEVDTVGFNGKDLVPEFRLKLDENKRFKLYSTLPDLNGDYKINSVLGFDDRLESEYCRVFFYLEQDSPLDKNSEVFIISKATLNTCLPEFKMEYNYNNMRYEGMALLKQGYYNYTYGLRTDQGLDLSYFEGSHFQTENDFHIISYDSNPNIGYDRVIGLYATNTFNN